MLHFSEILVILAVVLLIFGTGKFPKIMQNFAEGIKSFKMAMNEKDEKKDTKKKPSKKASVSKSKSVSSKPKKKAGKTVKKTTKKK